MRNRASKAPSAAPKQKTPLASAPEPGDPAGVDPDMLARLRAAAAMPDRQINLDDPDAPLVTDWSGAVRGKFFKPVKRLKSFRIDADVLAYFEGQGRGYQSTVNRVLREAMQRDLRRARAKAAPERGSKKATG